MGGRLCPLTSLLVGLVQCLVREVEVRAVLVSVVVLTCSSDNWPHFRDAVDSLLGQSYHPIEIVIVVDGNEELYQAILETYGGRDGVVVTLSPQRVGVSGARNLGVLAARGGIVAFIDDDAVADGAWVATLVDTYRQTGATAVGGKVVPLWLDGRPAHLPDELGWLVGVTYEGFAPDRMVEVRNALGPNMSFTRGVFERVGLFSEEFGFAARGNSNLQSEETHLAQRMRDEMGGVFIYNPEAVVYHKVSAAKTRLRAMLKRSFYQGCSKALLRRRSPSLGALGVEWSYLVALALRGVPARVKGLLVGPGRTACASQLFVLVACVAAVGLGFLYGRVVALPPSRQVSSLPPGHRTG